MLSMDELKTKLSKPLSILKNPFIKKAVCMKEFSKILRILTAWTNPEQTLCSPGCDFCCYRMPIFFSKFESEFVKSAIRYNLIDTTEWMAKYGLIWDRFTSVFGPTSEDTRWNWRGMRIPCPLLKDRKCAVYESRPVECRILWVSAQYMPSCFPEYPLFSRVPEPASHESVDDVRGLVSKIRQRYRQPSGAELPILNLMKDIDKWIYKYEGGRLPLIEAIR